MAEFETTITLDDETELEVTVEYQYYKGYPSWFDYRAGVGGPEEPAEVEVISITYPNEGQWIDIDAKESLFDLPEAERERIEQQCWKAVEESPRYEYAGDYE